MAGVTSMRDTSSLENASVEEITKRSTNIDKEKYFFNLKNTIATSSELAERHFNIFHSPNAQNEGLFNAERGTSAALKSPAQF